MLGYIWIFLIASSIIIGGVTGRIDAVVQAAMDSAKLAVDISISLIGVMAFWLGIMKLAELSGLIDLLSKAIKPVTKFLFPEVPSDHPALGNIAMNFSANILGLSNAATPLGINAMKELQKLNPNKNLSTNAMCTFLAINTAGFQIIPATIIAVLLAAGSKNPSVIIGPTIFATGTALISAIIGVKILEKIPMFNIQRYSQEETSLVEVSKENIG